MAYSSNQVLKVKVSVTQSCQTLCDPMDSSVHAILQARILEWIAIPFFSGIFLNQALNPGLPHCSWTNLPSEPPGKPKEVLSEWSLSCVQISETPWTVVHLCPYNFPSKNTGVGCHFFLQGIFPTQGSNPSLLTLLHWQTGYLPNKQRCISH